MRLTKYEKETIFLTSQGDNIYEIYTFNPALKRKLEEYSCRYPRFCTMITSTPEGSATYIIDKSRVSIRFMPPITEEQRERGRESRKKNRLKGVK